MNRKKLDKVPFKCLCSPFNKLCLGLVALGELELGHPHGALFRWHRDHHTTYGMLVHKSGIQTQKVTETTADREL